MTFREYTLLMYSNPSSKPASLIRAAPKRTRKKARPVADLTQLSDRYRWYLALKLFRGGGWIN
jgi:hypothetical protein